MLQFMTELLAKAFKKISEVRDAFAQWLPRLMEADKHLWCRTMSNYGMRSSRHQRTNSKHSPTER
jgi:hypothetical protein